MKFRPKNKPAWPDLMAQRQKANKNLDCGNSTFSCGFSGKPAWPDPMARRQKANKNLNCGNSTFSCGFPDKSS
ncbi:hypothetical protein [Desulfomarina sp.]